MNRHFSLESHNSASKLKAMKTPKMFGTPDQCILSEIECALETFTRFVSSQDEPGTSVKANIFCLFEKPLKESLKH